MSNEGSEAQDRQDMAAAFAACCPTSQTLVPATGHGWFLHPGQEVGYQGIVGWMQGSVLATKNA